MTSESHDLSCVCTAAIAGISDGPNVDCPEHGEPLRWNIAERTGLPAHVCRELLTAGWRYSEEIGRIPVWEHPTWALTEPFEGNDCGVEIGRTARAANC